MKFIELVSQRQSVRKYSDKPIEKEKIDLMIESARLAPSACNSQPWHLIVVDEPNLKNEVAKATFDGALKFNKFAIEAPVLFVIVMEKPKLVTQIGGRLKDKDYPLYDIGIFAEHICLQAAEFGIGTCMLGWFKEKKIKELLNIPKNKTIGLVITLGYPIEGYRQRQKFRKGTDDIVSYNSYRNY